MIRAIASVAALLFGAAILLTGQGLQGTLIPVRATLENFSTISIGLIGTTYFLGFTYGCWKGAVLIRWVGHVRVFAAMTATASAVSGMFAASAINTAPCPTIACAADSSTSFWVADGM